MLYKLTKNGETATREVLRRTTLEKAGWKEKDLENMISQNLDDFISDGELLTIFTERRGQEAPDIMALDRNGELYIFELKRWSGKKENLLQVLRYGQIFGRSTYDELNELYQKANKGVELAEVHKEKFCLENPLPLESYNSKQHFVVVTDGTDNATLEAINYWQGCGLDISTLIYYVYKIDNEYYFEVKKYSTTDYDEYDNNCYILNTDYGSSPEHHKAMLTERKAAAYHPGWRENIARLQKGDCVFLYQVGVGIVAYGYADGELRKAECDGFKDYEYYMHLSGFDSAFTPISASEIKNVTGVSFYFGRTMFSISDENANAIIKAIKAQRE